MYVHIMQNFSKVEKEIKFLIYVSSLYFSRVPYTFLNLCNFTYDILQIELSSMLFSFNVFKRYQ